MNILNICDSLGLKITWKLIDIELFGSNEIPVLLTHNEVLEYLKSSITSINERTDNVVALICGGSDTIEFDNLLKKFSCEENSNKTIQKRKWRACLLKKC